MARNVRTSPAAWLFLASSIAVWLCRAEAFAAEVCHFTGTTDYAGHVTVTTDAAATAGVTRIDVAAAFESTTMFWLGVRYLIEEVSTWRAGHLESVAVNSRYLLGNYIVRQQWDKFERSAEGFQAHRVQAKTLADFRRRHPGFVQHWDPATFRQPWLDDYQSASPERRADLDLRGSPLPSGLRSPLAMAFYWIRWLPRGDQDVPVFLPGFKAERLVDLPITAVPSASGTVWRALLRYSALSNSPPSTATAWISPDGYLLQMAFELHTWRGSGRGLINQAGCEGVPVARRDR
jgi:hypothetical protein